MSGFWSSEKRFFLLGWVICIISSLFYCYEYLLRIELSVMSDQVMKSFSIDAAGFGLLFAVYYWAYTPLQTIVGILTDRYGPRRVLLIALAFCILGCYLFGTTHNVFVAAAGRFMIGIGSAFAFVGVLKLAAIWLPQHQFPIFTGLTTSLGMIGAMFGDVELSRMVHLFGWHHVFRLSVFIGLVLMVLFFVVLRDHEHNKVVSKKYDYTGWFRLLRDFLKLIAHGQLWLVGIVGCILYLSLTVVAEIWGIPFLRSLYPLHPELAPQLNAMIFFGWLIGSPLSGWISDKVHSRRLPMTYGCILSALMMSAIIIFIPSNPYIMATLLFLFGLFSSAEILSFVIARESVGLRLVATAIGFINLLVMLGGMIIQPLVGSLIDLGWQGKVHAGVHVYSVTTYRHALIIVPVMMIIGAFLTKKMPESFKNQEFKRV
jgi:MFS family permease